MIDESIRQDFPLLVKNPNLIYFDNACMTLRPRAVVEAMDDYYYTFSACAGRSNHHLANRVNDEVDKAREKIRRLVGAKRREEIIFTRNTTEGLNLVAQSLKLQAGDGVVISDKEHNSNLVPWLRLKETLGIKLRIVEGDAWEKAINANVKVVSTAMTSNLDGTTRPIKQITKMAHEVGAVMVVDAAQAIPHQKISVTDLGVDYLAFSAHKMCGPSGMGALYGKYDLLTKLNPFLTGGDTVARTTYESYEMLPVPEKFEAGLQNYAGIIGFGAAADYIESVGLDKIHQQELQLNELLTKELTNDRIRMLGPTEASLRGGIASFTVEGADHHQVALMLDQMGNIAVRSGQHCVHSWFDHQHIPGSVRVSLYFYNTEDEVAAFSECLNKVLRII